MFALLAFLAFIVFTARDLWETAPEHQWAILGIGLALLALDAFYPLGFTGGRITRRTGV